MPQNNIWLPFKSTTNALVPAQLDKMSNLQVVQTNGTKYNLSYNKGIYFTYNAGVTTSAALTTTYTGLCLSNPAASTKNLSIRRVSANFDVAATTITAVGIIVGWAAGGITVHTTPITSLQPSFIGNTTVPQGLSDAACTLVGTPAWYTFLGQVAAAGSGSFSQDIEGAIIVPPGGYVAIGTSIASPTSSLWASIEWAEVLP